MAFKSYMAKDIDEVLGKYKRQYLVGDLKREQELKHISKKNIEFGITYYSEDEYTLPHHHTIQEEYQYVIEGETEYKDIDTGEIVRYKKGDFYYIQTGTCYSQSTKNGTKILFIKTPSVNDKVTCGSCERICNYKK